MILAREMLLLFRRATLSLLCQLAGAAALLPIATHAASLQISR